MVRSGVLPHTFAICAYKESPYLEECIRSLKKQTVPSEIIMATSTPNEHIRKLAEAYGIELYVNEGEGGIANDWNFACSKCKTPYITIAHQDDLYFPEYAERAIHALRRSKKPLIWFSQYAEIRNGEKVTDTLLLKIKRILLLPLRPSFCAGLVWVRRMSLAFGNGICCPAVTFARDNLPSPLFRTGYRASLDWECWEMLSREKGDFLYDPKLLMGHRIHEGSETTNVLEDHGREQEDFEMFCRFWPRPIAKLLAAVYKNSEKSNKS